MQKKFFVFLVALVWAFSLAGASISLSHVGIKGPSSNPVIPGQTVYIKVDYSLTDFDEEFGSVDGVCASTSVLMIKQEFIGTKVRWKRKSSYLTLMLLLLVLRERNSKFGYLY